MFELLSQRKCGNTKFRCGPEQSMSKYSSQTSTFKGEAVPLQAWSVPEGSRKLRFPDFMTTAQDGGKVVRLLTLGTGRLYP
jgi:hypothetical protein